MNHAALVEIHRRQKAERAALASLTAHHFDAQRSFYRPRRKSLRAALCSRRAGKTRGGNESDVELAAQTEDGRFLYVNETRAEAKRLAWHGARGDGMMAIVRDRGWSDSGKAVINESELTIRFPEINSWIYLIGVDDEAAIRKALGMPWNRVRWDEAQRIPPKFTTTILETLLPALLDYGGEFLMTGTPERKMSGLFYDVTRTDAAVKWSNWDVSRWTLTDNPYWGRPVQIGSEWFVVWGAKSEHVSGPHTPDMLLAAVLAARHLTGVMGLQELLGGPEVAPLDSPIMRRQAFGEWVREDSNFVYAVHRARDPFYAPARLCDDGFPDIAACLADLPGDWHDYTFSMGGDLGFRDAFALHCWGWRPHDSNLYELFSWKRRGLDSDQQFSAIKEIREVLPLGQIVVDAGGIGLQVSAAWSKVFVERYGLPIAPAEKHEKNSFQALYNTDIASSRVKFREGGDTFAEMAELCWSTLVSGTGRQIEDPTQDNHCADASLYSHRASYQYRARPEEVAPPVGSAAHYARQAAELEDENDEEFDWRRRGVA